MLSKKTLRLLIKGGQMLRLNVYTWDDASGQVGITKSKLTWFIVLITEFYLWGQCVFEVFRLYTLSGDPSEPFPDYMKLVLQWSSRCFAMVPQIDSLFYGANKATFVNQVFMLDSRFRQVDGGQKIKDPMKAMSWILFAISFINPIFTATGFLEDRYQSRYWHHLVFPASVFPFSVPMLGVLEYYITTHGMMTAMWYFWIVTVYFNTSEAWMKLVVNVEGITGWEWKTDKLLLIRTLQVYNQIYNNRMAAIWCIGLAAAFCIEVLSIVGTLILTPVMPFPANMMFPAAGAIGIWYTTSVYKTTTVACTMSEELAHTLKISGVKYTKVVGASMKPLRVEVRPFFYMKKTTSFAFTNEVTDKTISILLLA